MHPYLILLPFVIISIILGIIRYGIQPTELSFLYFLASGFWLSVIMDIVVLGLLWYWGNPWLQD